MRKYHALLSAIEGYYSVETGGDDENVAAFEVRLKADPERAELLRKDLLDSLEDADFSWCQALWNEDSHIEEFDSELRARDYVRSEVLSVIERACRVK